MKAFLLAHLACGLSYCLQKTLDIRFSADPHYERKKPYFFAFWHGKQWLPVLQLMQHQSKRAVLVSPSRDGDILALWLKRLGYETIRGSSRRDNQQALRGMMRKIKAGYSIGFGIDGPMGPIYRVKPGMTYLAQKFQIPIIPVGAAFARKWVLEKAWDRYEIPKPFSKAAFYLGAPMQVGVDADLTEANQQLENAIHQAESMAHDLLRGPG